MAQVKRTKRQLVFQPLSVLDEVRFRYEQHEKKYGVTPYRIYLPAEMFEEYKVLIPKLIMFTASIYYDDRVYFREAEVLSLQGATVTSDTKV